MDLFLAAVVVVVVAAAAGLGLWLAHRRNVRQNADLTATMIATVATQPTWFFTAEEMAAILDVTPEKAYRLIAALPEDDGQYRVTEDGIRYWTTEGNWSHTLFLYLGEQVLTCAADYRGRIVGVTLLAKDLHNTDSIIMSVLENLFRNPGTGNLVYYVDQDFRTIVVHGVVAGAH